jgi:hypothetical protein
MLTGQWNSREAYFQCTLYLLYYTECREVKSYSINRPFTLNQSLSFIVSRGPCKPDFHCGLFHLPDLCTDFDSGFSVYLAWLTDFDCWLFRLPNFDTLNLTTDIWNGAHGGCDRSAEDAYSFVAPDSTFAFVEGPCCPTLDFVIAFWLRLRFTHC